MDEETNTTTETNTNEYPTLTDVAVEVATRAVIAAVVGFAVTAGLDYGRRRVGAWLTGRRAVAVEETTVQSEED